MQIASKFLYLQLVLGPELHSLPQLLSEQVIAGVNILYLSEKKKIPQWRFNGGFMTENKEKIKSWQCNFRDIS